MIQVLNSSGGMRLVLVLLIFAGFCFWMWWIMLRMPLQSYRGGWTELRMEELETRDRLRADVNRLAGQIGERNVFEYPQMLEAVAFIEESLGHEHLEVRRQEFKAGGKTCYNVELEIPGGALREEIVVVGAHYDSVRGSPAANDNASGVAALFELARVFRDARPDRTVRFVAFANEEPPFFTTAEMGSLVYAKRARERKENIVAMMSLETIGFYSDEPRSQRYPFPLRLFYPTEGNFIGFVGNIGSRGLVREAVAEFRANVDFPSEGAALPQFIPGVGWSDHWSFWQYGYPGIMVTDTALYRYPYYHSPDDTPDKLDYDRMTRVVRGLRFVVEAWANPGN